MAFASKSQQREVLAKSYSAGESTLTSDGYKRTEDMKNSGKRLAGMIESGPGAPKLIGKTQDGKSSNLSGYMTKSGYGPSGGDGKAAKVPSRSAAKGNTVRMKFEGGEDLPSGWKSKNTGGTPKALKGGKAG